MTTRINAQRRRQREAERDRLIETHIVRHPRYSARSEAVVKETGAPVWALIGHLPVVNGDLDQLAYDYGISREAADAALAYYERHREIIDDRIEANDITRHW